MNYYTKGKVFEKGAITEGMSQNGNRWQRMTLVLDVQVGQYSKKMAFQVMTGNIASVQAFNTGDMVEVSWDVSSREWTNKEGVRSWFTQVDLRDIKAKTAYLELLKEGDAGEQPKTVVDSIYPGEVH
jgi:hypothetical protein